jgi:hypothetical protein
MHNVDHRRCPACGELAVVGTRAVVYAATQI